MHLQIFPENTLVDLLLNGEEMDEMVLQEGGDSTGDVIFPAGHCKVPCQLGLSSVIRNTLKKV